jgi:hypothetical protein
VSKQVSAQVQERMQRTMAPLLEDVAPLKERVQAIAKKRETRAKGEALIDQIAKEEARVQRLVVQNTRRGNKNNDCDE